MSNIPGTPDIVAEVLEQDTSDPAAKYSNTMMDLQYKLLEEGNLSTEDAYTLTLVTTGNIPYDEYQELLSDRRNHSSRLGRFAVQVAVSGSVSAFAMGMLIAGGDAGVYLPVLTAILGYWLPAPDFSKHAATVKKTAYSKPQIRSSPVGKKTAPVKI